jgi:hypothetical protein
MPSGRSLAVALTGPESESVNRSSKAIFFESAKTLRGDCWQEHLGF